MPRIEYYKPTMLLLGVALILGGCTTASDDAETLTTAEIHSLLVGQTIDSGDGGMLRFNRNGTYQKLHKPNLRPLRYSITNNQLCLVHENRPQRCYTLSSKRDGYYVVNSTTGEFRITVRAA